MRFKTEAGFPINIPCLFHEYKVVKQLANGSTSIVILVEDQNTKQKYSAKIISKKDIEDRHLSESIQKEIRRTVKR